MNPLMWASLGLLLLGVLAVFGGILLASPRCPRCRSFMRACDSWPGLWRCPRCGHAHRG